MKKALNYLFLVLMVSTTSLFAKAEIKEDKKIQEEISKFEFVKRRTAWMYNLEVFNPDKNMLTAKIFAIDESNKELEIKVNKFDKIGISKKFENKNYKSLKAKLFKNSNKIDEKSIDLPKVMAEIVSFSVKSDRWFLKVRNKTFVSMEFKIVIAEEEPNGIKTTLLEYETQNLDSEITHSRTAVLQNTTVNNRLTLIVKDTVTDKILAAKTVTLK